MTAPESPASTTSETTNVVTDAEPVPSNDAKISTHTKVEVVMELADDVSMALDDAMQQEEEVVSDSSDDAGSEASEPILELVNVTALTRSIIERDKTRVPGWGHQSAPTLSLAMNENEAATMANVERNHYQKEDEPPLKRLVDSFRRFQEHLDQASSHKAIHSNKTLETPDIAVHDCDLPPPQFLTKQLSEPALQRIWGSLTGGSSPSNTKPIMLVTEEIAADKATEPQLVGDNENERGIANESHIISGGVDDTTAHPIQRLLYFLHHRSHHDSQTAVGNEDLDTTTAGNVTTVEAAVVTEPSERDLPESQQQPQQESTEPVKTSIGAATETPDTSIMMKPTMSDSLQQSMTEPCSDSDSEDMEIPRPRSARRLEAV